MKKLQRLLTAGLKSADPDFKALAELVQKHGLKEGRSPGRPATLNVDSLKGTDALAFIAYLKSTDGMTSVEAVENIKLHLNVSQRTAQKYLNEARKLELITSAANQTRPNSPE